MRSPIPRGVCLPAAEMGLSKVRVPYFGVLIIRILLFRVPY